MLLRKRWQFWAGTWNVDSLTGRAGEVAEALSDRKVDMGCIQEIRWKVVVASSMELKCKDVSCSGWEVRRDWIVSGYLYQRNGWTVLLVSKTTHTNTPVDL